MKFTLTFILLVVVGIIGLVVITTKSGEEDTPDITDILSEATQSADFQQYPNMVTKQPLPQSPTPTKELNVAQKAVIKTSKGDIALTLFPEVAPQTVSNFVTKAQGAFYDDLTFHRVEDWVIQGGDPRGDGTGGGNMPTELNKKPFVKGSLGVARGGDIKISNDAQFFITKSEADWLNEQYTNFGIVTEGMDIVEQIEIGDKILSITTE